MRLQRYDSITLRSQHFPVIFPLFTIPDIVSYWLKASEGPSVVSWLHPLQANLSFLNSRDFGVIPATYYEGAVVNGLPYVLGDNVVVSPGEDENVWRSMHAKEVSNNMPTADCTWYVQYDLWTAELTWYKVCSGSIHVSMQTQHWDVDACSLVWACAHDDFGRS